MVQNIIFLDVMVIELQEFLQILLLVAQVPTRRVTIINMITTAQDSFC